MAWGLGLLWVLAGNAGADPPPAPAIHNSRFVYSNEEKLGFDLEKTLRSTAPHLLPYREMISHWSGYATVSPRMVLSLMELETRQLTGGSASTSRPFGDLSTAETFEGQVEDVLRRLAERFYDRPAGHDGLRAATAADEALSALLAREGALEELRDRYESLFPDQPPLHQARAEPAGAKTVPPPHLLQLPYPVGQSWYFGCTHTFNGMDPGPPSSLDFSRNLETWGANTSNTWVVVAAHPGTAIVYSSCFVEVLGANGWSTSY